MTTWQVEEQIERYRDRAAAFVHTWGTQVPVERFEDVDGTPDNALVLLTAREVVTLVAAAMAAARHTESCQNGHGSEASATIFTP